MSSSTAPALLPQTVRILTPVFYYRLDGADNFTHAETHNGADFKVDLRSYVPTDLEEIINHAHVNNREMIRQGFQRPPAAVSHVLLIEVNLPGSAYALDMGVPAEIQQSTVEALRLHSSAGLPNDGQFVFSDSPHLGIMQWVSRQIRIFQLPSPSVLSSADFAACRATGDMLRSKTWGNTTFDKVVSLAKDYHRVVLTLEKVEHAFLILMVAYEAMFKKDNTENASQAAQRIGRLLGATQKDCLAIQKKFNDDPDSFSKMRNDIAHGDPGLNLATVAGKYPSLYRHVTAAIVKLLNLPSGALDSTTDYYGALTRYTDARCNSLPRR